MDDEFNHENNAKLPFGSFSPSKQDVQHGWSSVAGPQPFLYRTFIDRRKSGREKQALKPKLACWVIAVKRKVWPRDDKAGVCHEHFTL